MEEGITLINLINPITLINLIALISPTTLCPFPCLELVKVREFIKLCKFLWPFGD
jgi:hypothetical protein